MFDVSRLIVCTSMLGFLRLVNIAPNEGNELHEGDKVAVNGAPKQRFLKQVMFAMVECKFLEYHLLNYGSQELAMHEWMMVALAMGLFSLRLWCYQKLGKFFTYTIMVKENHPLIADGPYAYLIHPSYTGQVGVMLLFITFMLGFNISLMWLLGLPMMFFIVKVLRQRMAIEEAHMAEHIGTAYQIYASKRKRLIPFIY